MYNDMDTYVIYLICIEKYIHRIHKSNMPSRPFFSRKDTTLLWTLQTSSNDLLQNTLQKVQVVILKPQSLASDSFHDVEIYKNKTLEKHRFNSGYFFGCLRLNLVNNLDKKPTKLNGWSLDFSHQQYSLFAPSYPDMVRESQERWGQTTSLYKPLQRAWLWSHLIQCCCVKPLGFFLLRPYCLTTPLFLGGPAVGRGKWTSRSNSITRRFGNRSANVQTKKPKRFPWHSAHTMPILITLFTSTCQEINGKLPISDGAYTESTESSLQRNNYDLSKFLLQVVWDLKVVDPSDPSFPSSNCVETSFGSDGRNTEDRQIASVGEFWRVRFVGWKK